jgi:hypothetical protein
MKWFDHQEEVVNVSDEMLEAQKPLQSLVRGLPEDDLSMAWRSQLNLKLLAESDRKHSKRKSIRFAAWGSSLGLGATTLVAAFVMMSSPKSLPTSDNVAQLKSADLVQIHQETTAFANVSGTGATQVETSFVSNSDMNEYDYDLL